MENLTHNDIHALNNAIGDIYAVKDMESFYMQAFASIRSLVSCDLISYNETIFPAKIVKGLHGSPDHHHFYRKMFPVFNAFSHQHPFAERMHEERPIMTSDYASRKRFKDTDVYNEYYRHLDVENQMCVGLTTDKERPVVFALNRKTPGFTERERLILTLLRPHIISAMRKVKELCRLRLERDLLEKGVEAEGQGAVLLDGEGTVLGMTPLATEFMKKYLDAAPTEGDMIAGELMTWFRRESSSPQLKIERPPFVIEKGQGCLKITLLRDRAPGECILLMSERKAGDLLDIARRYGLSCREAEALHWVAKGKTNLEIGIILGISVKTVEKHLEHAYAKLGVENRIGAIAMAMENLCGEKL